MHDTSKPERSFADAKNQISPESGQQKEIMPMPKPSALVRPSISWSRGGPPFK